VNWEILDERLQPRWPGLHLKPEIPKFPLCLCASVVGVWPQIPQLTLIRTPAALPTEPIYRVTHPFCSAGALPFPNASIVGSLCQYFLVLIAVEIGELYRLPLPVKTLKAQPGFADVTVEKPMVSSVRLPEGQREQAEMPGVQKYACAPLPAELVSVRCPQCRKLLAKCAVYGTIEIVCTRCKAVVRQVFGEFVPEELRSF